jgi:cysteine desulfurase
VDGSGSVSPEDVEKALRPDTILVSVSLANNEVGVIQPLAEISKITKKHKIYLHTDAVQAVGHIAVDVEELNLDLLSLSAHKFYGPKGVGALYVRSGTPIAPLMHGGHQESKRRAGTENVAGIVGMGEALFLSAETLENEITRLSLLRDHLIYGLEEKIPHVYVNGPRPDTPGQRQVRLPGNVNMSFSFVEGESLLMLLDMQGCSASTGSACASGSLDPSHVLMAMGISHERANSALRFTLGRHTTERDVKALIKMLPPIVNRLREMSPMYTDFVNKEK